MNKQERNELLQELQKELSKELEIVRAIRASIASLKE